jgi:CysZ protein
LTAARGAANQRRMLRALSLTFGQLGDPAILSVLAKSLALTILIFLIAGTGLVFAARWATEAWGWGPESGMVAAAVAAVGALAAAWLLFRAVAVPVIGLFADEVVAAIEAKHYPEAAQVAKPASVAISLRLAIVSLIRLIGFNLLALPLYGVLLFTAVGPIILFVAINALLLGRDLGEMVAIRHMDRAAMKDWLDRTRGQRAFMGLAVTGLFLVPILNLIAPIIGAGLATHMFHGSRA